MNIGDRFETNNYGCAEVISAPRKGKCLIKFLDTGNEKLVTTHFLKKGMVGDSKKPSAMFGIGITGDGNTASNKKAYKAWVHMLERCYDNRYHSYDLYGGAGVKVCSEWLEFTNFLNWFESQPNSGRAGMELDKDLKKGMIYSPENCMMIPKSINTATIKKRKKNSLLPSGISNRFGSFQVSLSEYGKTTHIGSFKCIDDAVKAYKEEKKAYLSELAEIEFLNGLISFDAFNIVNNYEV